MIPDVAEAEFERLMQEATAPVLLEFWKSGCGGCRALTKELERLQPEVEGRLLILKMNVEENYQLPAELEISSLPALALFRNGVFEKFVGGLGMKQEILKQIGLEARG